jgi:hypothetical protein
VRIVDHYRHVMWGNHQPSMNGRPVGLAAVHAGDGDARSINHAVLAYSRSGEFAYDPWPQADGSAYSRPVDGPGAHLGRPHSAGASTHGFLLR